MQTPELGAHDAASRAAVRAAALPVQAGLPSDAALFDLVGDARFVLIGEATHGTHEFYTARAAITRRLIEQRGFCAVAVEADWPDAYRVNRFVRGRGDDPTAAAALAGFERFPTWLWRNHPVREFVDWLRAHNRRTGGYARGVGFYGLDLYSLFRSMHEVIGYLDGVDAAAAQRARQRYACFDHASGGDGPAYGYSAAFGAGDDCQEQVLEQLVDLQRHALEYARRDGMTAQDELFYAERNARLVKAAAAYYRSMFTGRVASWNLRDRHMVDTLFALQAHLTRQRGAPAKVVVWAHNSHLGDARATERTDLAEVNVGQLLRQRDPSDCRLIGFTTYTGMVTAAEQWDGPAQRKRVRPGLAGSVEELLHRTGGPRHREFLLRFDQESPATAALRPMLLERAIGVVYRPETERLSHYFRARVADQFDALVYLDETRAVEPLDATAEWRRGEAAQPYPAARPAQRGTRPFW